MSTSFIILRTRKTVKEACLALLSLRRHNKKLCGRVDNLDLTDYGSSIGGYEEPAQVINDQFVAAYGILDPA